MTFTSSNSKAKAASIIWPKSTLGLPRNDTLISENITGVKPINSNFTLYSPGLIPSILNLPLVSVISPVIIDPSDSITEIDTYSIGLFVIESNTVP